MIVNYLEDGWNIITQRSHGLLAGQICYHWKQKLRPEIWMETLVATIEHDDAFSEFERDEALLNKNGGPVNFKMREFEPLKCDQLLRMALTKSMYIGLLTSRHIQFLYGESADQAAKKYCRELQKKDGIWLKELSITEEETSKAYAILEWCDALSLLICQQMIQPENRKIEISSGPEDQCYQLHAPAEKVLTVEPWPFEPDEFEIHYESRLIPQLAFTSEQEFRKALMDTVPVLHSYRFVKGS
jgi:hypothetical protein